MSCRPRVGHEVRERVDVVDVRQAVPRSDEVLDAADVDRSGLRDAQHVADDVGGRRHSLDLELPLRGRLGNAVIEVGLADVGGAEVEVGLAVVRDADRVEVLAVEELDTGDRAVLGLEVLLHERRPIGPEVDAGGGSRREFFRCFEAPHERPGSADVRLHDHGETQANGRRGETARVVDDASARRADAKAIEEQELQRLRRLEPERRAAIHDGDVPLLEEREELPGERDARQMPADVGRRRDLVERERPFGRACGGIERLLVREHALEREAGVVEGREQGLQPRLVLV